jgi:hypothetical protein
MHYLVQPLSVRGSIVQLVLASDTRLSLTTRQKEMLQYLISEDELRSLAATDLAEEIRQQPGGDIFLNSDEWKVWWREFHITKRSDFHGEIQNVLNKEQLRIVGQRVMASALAPNLTGTVEGERDLNKIFMLEVNTLTDKELKRLAKAVLTEVNDTGEIYHQSLETFWNELLQTFDEDSGRKFEKKLSFDVIGPYEAAAAKRTVSQTQNGVQNELRPIEGSAVTIAGTINWWHLLTSNCNLRTNPLGLEDKQKELVWKAWDTSVEKLRDAKRDLEIEEVRRLTELPIEVRLKLENRIQLIQREGLIEITESLNESQLRELRYQGLTVLFGMGDEHLTMLFKSPELGIDADTQTILLAKINEIKLKLLDEQDHLYAAAFTRLLDQLPIIAKERLFFWTGIDSFEGR